MKRAVAAAAGVLGTLILVVALGVGYLAGHSSSARAGASTVTHPAAHTATGPASSAAPVKASLDVMIYGDSTSVPAIYGDGTSVPVGTTTSVGTTTVGITITVMPTGGGTGVISAAIYGD